MLIIVSNMGPHYTVLRVQSSAYWTGQILKRGFIYLKIDTFYMLFYLYVNVCINFMFHLSCALSLNYENDLDERY